MTGFKIITKGDQEIRFGYYLEEAPITCSAFDELLPFEKTFLHARISGQEIWTDKASPLNIIQENASVFTEPGEVVYGPLKPKRASTSNCMGIYYGPGKGLDACNIFACVLNEDKELLKILGEEIWKKGEQLVRFEKWEN
ncbi:MAG: DUF3830 family protein [Flavobacteriales bacterium]